MKTVLLFFAMGLAIAPLRADNGEIVFCARFYNAPERSGRVTGISTKFFTDGEGLFWSPDGRRFVTYFGRDLAPYGKALPGRPPHRVWVSPLLVGDSATGKAKVIVSGLVYVVGADWRPRQGR